MFLRLAFASLPLGDRDGRGRQAKVRNDELANRGQSLEQRARHNGRHLARLDPGRHHRLGQSGQNQIAEQRRTNTSPPRKECDHADEVFDRNGLG